MEKQAWKAIEKVKREGSERVERPGTDRQTDSSTMPGGSPVSSASSVRTPSSFIISPCGRCMKSVANDGMGLTERRKEGGRGQEAGVAIDGMGLTWKERPFFPWNSDQDATHTLMLTWLKSYEAR
ncbi:uncharacterized protein RSE6_09536 [Rhynchosporium secalis]|uniref:Uncharacterized protein n=1 Tax=Rhynchosporium secalis TaxID=38038 RepID=A0A1E1MI96_RHYSE|nr:uncharacterized protein RSE6_09536 [Rhynchosporium secalis]